MKDHALAYALLLDGHFREAAALLRQIIRRTPLGRLGTPEDVVQKLRAASANPRLNFAQYVAQLPVAFTVLVPVCRFTSTVTAGWPL